MHPKGTSIILAYEMFCINWSHGFQVTIHKKRDKSFKIKYLGNTETTAKHLLKGQPQTMRNCLIQEAVVKARRTDVIGENSQLM